MKTKNFYLIKIVIILIINIDKKAFSRDCFIYNKKYDYESLYQPNNGSIVYAHPLSEINDMWKALWSIRVTRSGSIYIQSIYTQEYLCATPNYYKSDQKRRLLKMKKYREAKSCEWNIKQSISNDSNENGNDVEKKFIFLVWNVLYNEALYAPIFYYKKDKNNRNLFLWSAADKSKHLKSDCFKWIFECLD